VVSARRRFPRSTARWKIARGWPCAVKFDPMGPESQRDALEPIRAVTTAGGVRFVTLTTYYVRIDDTVLELGETQLFSVAESMPGTAFLSEASAAAGAGGRRAIALNSDPSERRKFVDEVDDYVSRNGADVYVATMLALRDVAAEGLAS
jgi:hypothetical protein